MIQLPERQEDKKRNADTPCPDCQVRLIEKILELETCIQTLVEDSKNVRTVDTALDATSSGSPVHCSVPDEPVQQGN